MILIILVGVGLHFIFDEPSCPAEIFIQPGASVCAYPPSEWQPISARLVSEGPICTYQRWVDIPSGPVELITTRLWKYCVPMLDSSTSDLEVWILNGGHVFSDGFESGGASAWITVGGYYVL